MSCDCSTGTCTSCKNCKCTVMLVVKILLIVGGLNWGLVGVGMLMGKDLNLVNMIFGSMSTIEAVVYVVVGLAALMKIFGCPCAKCKACKASCASTTTGGTM